MKTMTTKKARQDPPPCIKFGAGRSGALPEGNGCVGAAREAGAPSVIELSGNNGGSEAGSVGAGAVVPGVAGGAGGTF
jgi:hypothetical protein